MHQSKRPFLTDRPFFFWIAVIAASTVSACGSPSEPQSPKPTTRLSAKYDSATGKLKKVELDQNKNGHFETFAYWEADRLDRIEIDTDEDNKIDRWEHYGDQKKLLRVGSSSRDDEVEDTWAYPDETGFLARVETDQNRDGVIDKREIFTPGAGGVGRILTIVEMDLDKSGSPGRRLYYRSDGSFEKSEKLR